MPQAPLPTGSPRSLATSNDLSKTRDVRRAARDDVTDAASRRLAAATRAFGYCHVVTETGVQRPSILVPELPALHELYYFGKGFPKRR